MINIHIARLLVNRVYYLAKYDDVSKAGVDPIEHFAAYGLQEPIRSPNAFIERLMLQLSPYIALFLLMRNSSRKDWLSMFQDRFRQTTFGKYGNGRFGYLIAQAIFKRASADEDHRMLSVFQAFRIDEQNLLSSDDRLVYHPSQGAHVNNPIYLNKLRWAGKPITITTPARSVYMLRMVTARTQSRLIFPAESGVVYHKEYAEQKSGHAPKSSDVKYLGQGKILTRMADAVLCLDKAVHLMHEHDANFFHWTIEVLPRLILAKQCKEISGWPILLNANLHANLIRLFDAVNDEYFKPEFVASGKDVLIRNLAYPSDTSSMGDIYNRKPRRDETILISPELHQVKDILNNKFRNVTNADAGGGFYYLRRRGGVRTMQNEDDIVNTLADLGFNIVDVDKFSLEDHVHLWSSARIIVAPTGAVLTNMLWCRPGTAVVCLISDHIAMNPYFWQQVADISGVNLSYLVGRRQKTVTGIYAIHDDFRIEKRDIMAGLKKIMKDY